jgi:hypothetical protein
MRNAAHQLYPFDETAVDFDAGSNISLVPAPLSRPSRCSAKIGIFTLFL